MKKIVKLFPRQYVMAESEAEYVVTFEHPASILSIRAFAPWYLEGFRIKALEVDGERVFVYDVPAEMFSNPTGYALIQHHPPSIRTRVRTCVRNIGLAQANFELLAEVEEDEPSSHSSSVRGDSCPSADFEGLLDELRKVFTSLYFAAPEDHRRFRVRASDSLNKLADMLGLTGKAP